MIILLTLIALFLAGILFRLSKIQKMLREIINKMN